MIEYPDLIVLADETLFDAADVHILGGQEQATAVFINSADVESIVEKYDIAVPVQALDVTKLTLDTFGRASALSAGMAAAAARMMGSVSQQQMLEAVRDELAHLDIEASEIDKNALVAERVFTAVAPVEFQRKQMPVRGAIATVGYDSPLLGTPSVLHSGNALARRTGSWRVERPDC